MSGTMEFLIDGTWTDVTSATRGNGQVRIDRGRRDIQGSALLPPTTMDFVLNNGGEDPADRGRFTDDNPLSEYFELLPQYTQCRFSVSGAADHFMYLPGHDTINYARTADKAALDITGDIDMRIEVSPASWTMPHADDNFSIFMNMLAAKCGGAALSTQFSWAWRLTSEGTMCFTWSEDGDGEGVNAFSAFSDVIPEPADRMALRVTLDVNNGAAGYTVVFYTSDSIDGSWTTLTTVTSAAAGTTSIFSSTGTLEVGAGGLGTGLFSNTKTYSGKIYAYELRSSIAGTIVAEADFRALPFGNANFSDGLGNTWEIRNGARVASDSIRFWGEIEDFPDEWDSTGKDMLCRVHAADLLSRLGAPNQPAHSPIYTTFIQQETASYWPYEDGSTATFASTATPGASKGTVLEVNFQAADDLPGSAGVAQFASGGALARGQARPTTVTGEAYALIMFRFPSAPATTVQIASYTMHGSNSYWWRVETDGTNFLIKAFDSDGASLLSTSGSISGVDLTTHIVIRIKLVQDGANIDWELAWFQLATDTIWLMTGTFAGTVGVFSGYTVSGSSSNTDMFFSHVILDSTEINIGFDTSFLAAMNGFIGESFADRFRRVCAAIGVTADIDGWKFDTSRVGRQPIDTPLNILQDGADVDGGFLMGSRRAGNTLTYVTRSRVQTAPYVMSLAHNTSSHLATTPKPTRSPVGVRNDVTVHRPGGGYSRVVVTDGRYGTDAIGTVAAEETYNVYTDSGTDEIAGWLAALGTSGERRFPEISVGLHRQQTLTGSTIGQAVAACDLGRWAEITDLPAGQAPGPHEQIIQGYSEVHDNLTWMIVFNGTPYGPWRAGVFENGTEPLRFAASSTVLGTGVNSSATSIDFKTPDTSARWITSTEMSSAFPMQVMISGELLTLTALTGTTASGGFYTQTGTVTRSVNGIVKSLPINAVIQLKRILRFAR